MEMRAYYKMFFLTSLLFGAIAFIPTVHAQEIGLVSEPTSSSTTRVNVVFNPNNEAFNAIDVTIVTPKEAVVSEVTSAGSALSLFPVPPQYTSETRTITMTGGLPGSFALSKDSVLMSFVVVTKQSLTFRVSGNAYRADGKGTKLSIPVRSIAISSSPGDATPSAPDNLDPVMSAYVGRDESLFGGRYYVVWYGSDNRSGTLHYQVKEGWWGTFHDASGYYIVQDQSLGAPVWVRATDEAGNSTTVLVSGTNTSLFIPGVGLALILIAIVGFIVLKRKRKVSVL